VPTPTTAPGIASLANPLIQNMLSAIYGPNFQNLLGTGQYQPPQQPDPNQNPALIEAKAYAGNLSAKNTAMHAYDSYQRALQVAQDKVSSSRSTSFGGWVDPNYNNAASQLVNLQTGGQSDAAMKISQAAALSPSYAPTIFQSVGQGNNNRSWNPYGTSGWISPVQSGFGQSPSIASSIMSMGA
jgi:hypothetical protein